MTAAGLEKARRQRALNAAARALAHEHYGQRFGAWSRRDAELWARYLHTNNPIDRRAWLAHLATMPTEGNER